MVRHTLTQLIEACNLILDWNQSTRHVDDYLSSTLGVQTMAASCMMIESIGEGIKKIDTRLPGFLASQAPETPWREIKGLRDHIAHGYFKLDADIIFDVVSNEISPLKQIFISLCDKITQMQEDCED